MLKNLRAGLLLVAMVGCTASQSGPIEPQQQVVVTPPVSGVKVSATIAAVTLGDGCSSGASCADSNVQIAFNAEAGSNKTSIEVVKATVVDASSGELVDTLTSSDPQLWNGNGYAAWDQNVPAGGDLKASYTLSSPDWSKIDGKQTGRSMGGSYAKSFTLHLTLRIGGVEIILESSNLHRQPQFAT